MENELKQLKDKLEIFKKYHHALALIEFDIETVCPEDSREEQSDTLNFFSNELFKLQNSKETNDLIVLLHDHINEIKDPLDVCLVNDLYDGYLKTKNMTPEFELKMSKIYSNALDKWLRAKEKSDYSLFKDALKDVIAIQEEAINLREKKLSSFYDNALDDNEEGMVQADLDPFFEELRDGLIDLINKIKNSKVKIRTDFLSRHVPIHKQEEFGKYLLNLNGFSFNRGNLAVSEHPFTSDIAKNDARVTTHYYEDQFVSNIYSVIHEGGHAIFMQNQRNEDYDHYINDSMSNGMHESVSRFYENIIGKSKAYIHLIYPKFIEIFKEELGDVSEEELYKAVNIVEPSLIRTEADEVTYGLHIAIRYEMEKKIANKEIDFDEIPATWNRLYKEYLGVDVPSDTLGVLQDIHWSGGFGYFPSYALGNCYNAMYFNRMKHELDFENLILKGDFKTINDWMRQNVFAKANVLKPKEWLKDITGRELTSKDFIDYLTNKYKEIYEF